MRGAWRFKFRPLICTGLAIFYGSIYATTPGMLNYTPDTDAKEKIRIGTEDRIKNK